MSETVLETAVGLIGAVAVGGVFLTVLTGNGGYVTGSVELIRSFAPILIVGAVVVALSLALLRG